MKAVVVREMTALILRPPTAPSTVNTSGHGPAAAGPSKHIRFAENSTTTTKPKSKPPKKGQDTRKPLVGNSHSRYYAAITFNQIVLTAGDREVALQLMDVYFEMFREILGVQTAGKEEEEGHGDGEIENDGEVRVDKKGRVVDKSKKGKSKGDGEVKGAAGFAEVEDSHSKLVSAILTGINRAVPFAKLDAGDARYVSHQLQNWYLVLNSTALD